LIREKKKKKKMLKGKGRKGGKGKAERVKGSIRVRDKRVIF
jgi:hypothetical protein